MDIDIDLRNEIYVARSPIFDRHRNVYAYEMRFRSNDDNYFNRMADFNCTGPVMLAECLTRLGLKGIQGNKQALINLTPKSLLKARVYQVPREQIIVELPDTISPAPPLINIFKTLSNHGFTLALDDFVLQEKFEPLLPFADIIKVDSTALPRFAEFKEKVSLTNARGKAIRLMMVNVDSERQFQEAGAAGFSYFQGNFCSQPVIVEQNDLSSGKMNLLRLFNELCAPSVDLKRIESRMKREVELTYSFLRFINSASFGFVKEVRSIRHAVNLVGLAGFKQWFALMLLGRISADKPDEIFMQSVTRAKLCESIAVETAMAERQGEAFLMGMFSLIDVLLGKKMMDILELLPLAGDIKEALTGRLNSFRRVLELVMHYEQGHWQEAEETADKIPFPMPLLPGYYFDAVDWANQLDRQ